MLGAEQSAAVYVIIHQVIEQGGKCIARIGNQLGNSVTASTTLIWSFSLSPV